MIGSQAGDGRAPASVAAARAGPRQQQQQQQPQRRQAAKARAPATRNLAGAPLRCICNLCSCGCADFDFGLANGRATGDEADLWLACEHHGALEERYLTGGRKARSAMGQLKRESEEQEEREEREGQEGQEQGQGQEQGADKDAGEAAACQWKDGREEREQRGTKRATVRQASEDARELQQDELLHVLVTRPEIASKPRDNIVFEGDMDLRTTFETSYEALARMRLEHWKGQQQRPAGESERTRASSRSPVADLSERGNAAAVASPSPAADASAAAAADRQRAQARGESAASQPGAVQLTSARMIRSPARLRGGDSLIGTGLDLGRARYGGQAQAQRDQQPQSQTQTRALASVSPALPEPRDTVQSPFVDPDLSPIIVYDANLNRLERVGLRKRSKYRPSTSLRPGGGGGFFGQSRGEPDEQEDAPQAKAQALSPTPLDGDERELGPARGIAGGGGGGVRDKRDAQEAAREPSVSPGGGASDFCLRDRAAGATSERLNRAAGPGLPFGRKHNMDHVNRVDHIKQFNLVENEAEAQQAGRRRMSDKATLTEARGDEIWPLEKRAERPDGAAAEAAAAAAAAITAGQHEGRAPSPRASAQTNANANDDHGRDGQDLALLEEAAAVAEIQRAANFAARPEREGLADTRTPLTAQGGRRSGTPSSLAQRQRADESASGAARDSPYGLGHSPAPPTGGPDRMPASRQARMQRVCQHQSFNIHENEYPEVRKGALSEASIKIGGRDTVEMGARGGVSPLELAPSRTGGRMSVNNLFRESPDFILTTTCARTDGRRSRTMTQPERGATGNDHANDEFQPRPGATSSVSRAGSLRVDFNNEAYTNEDHEAPGRRGAASEGATCFKCRVLDLGQDFQFVGSSLGHSYFVERHLENPISEMA